MLTVLVGCGAGGTTGLGGVVVAGVEVGPKLGGASSSAVSVPVAESSSKEKFIEGGASAAKTVTVLIDTTSIPAIKIIANFAEKFLFLDIFLFLLLSIIAKNEERINRQNKKNYQCDKPAHLPSP